MRNNDSEHPAALAKCIEGDKYSIQQKYPATETLHSLY
jgi:hypothetical protein